MRKYLFFIAFAVIVGAQPTCASVADSTAHVNSLLSKEVGRNTILQLELNEMQYIKLRELSESYQNEASITKEVEANYKKAIMSILTAKQITYLYQSLTSGAK